MTEQEFNQDINTGNGIFGLPFESEESLVQIIPVPWDLTASYGKGASKGPQAIFNASFQLDLFHEFYPDFWKRGIFMHPQPAIIEELNLKLRQDSQKIIHAFNENRRDNEIDQLLEALNHACTVMNTYVYDLSNKILNSGKIPIVLGGDHSVALGLMKSLSENGEPFGILQIDAHADLRKAYQGFLFSHASVMYNAVRLPGVSTIVQLGLRDYCSEEDRRIRGSQGKIISFTDRYLQSSMFEGQTWEHLCTELLETLPSRVYISFDIDGLDPRYCPNTGTPVPGGPSLEQIFYLLEMISESGRKIIGADLCEVAPAQAGYGEWDANVGARALLELCIVIIYSNSR